MRKSENKFTHRKINKRETIGCNQEGSQNLQNTWNMAGGQSNQFPGRLISRTGEYKKEIIRNTIERDL